MSLAQYTGTIFVRSGRIFRVTACTENSSPLKQKHINSRNTCVSQCQNSACCSASEFPLHRSLAGCRNFKTGAWEKFHPSKIIYNPNTTFVTEYVFFYRDYWNLNTNLWGNPELLWLILYYIVVQTFGRLVNRLIPPLQTWGGAVPQSCS